MGYSTSMRAIKRVQPFLEQLVRAEGKIEWDSDDPSRDSYALRDGIKSAEARAVRDGVPNEPFYSYARLYSKYIIRTAPGKVIAEPRDSVPIVALRESHAAMSIPDVSNELEVVGAAITHNAPKMHFPDVAIGECDLEAVHNWASQNGYFMVMGDGLTLTRDDPGAIAWTP